jgi:hypothetical protein
MNKDGNCVTQMLSFTKFIYEYSSRMTHDYLSMTAIKDQIQRGLNLNKTFEEIDWLQRNQYIIFICMYCFTSTVRYLFVLFS